SERQTAGDPVPAEDRLARLRDQEGSRRAVPEGCDKVKVMIMFRGREQSRPEMGMRLLERLADDVTELGHVESRPRLDGRNMTMVIGPNKKKSEARGQNKRRRSAGKNESGEATDAG